MIFNISDLEIDSVVSSDNINDFNLSNELIKNNQIKDKYQKLLKLILNKIAMLVIKR